MELRKKMIGVLDEIDEVVECFYQQQEQKGYQCLETTIGDITMVVDDLFQYKQQNDTFDLDEQRLVGGLTEAMNALSAKDTILLADVLQYEITEQFKDIMNRL